jgi:acylphosphatase
MPSMEGSESNAQVERLTAMIKGRVQAVGYRAFLQRHARDLGLAGHAENLPDGRVEVLAEGPRDALETLLVHIRNGPTHAHVDDVEVAWGEAVGERGFHTY